MFRLVATDLDGTLLRSDKTISKETEEMLSSLYERGIIFAPSTGRTHIELPEQVTGISHLHYAITCNGGGVYDFIEQKYIFSQTIDRELGERVLKACANLPVYPTFVCEGMRYMQAKDNGKIADYVWEKAAPGIVDKAHGCKDIVKKAGEMSAGLQKIFLYSKDAGMTQDVLSCLRSDFSELSITTSGPIYIEINAAGIDKGKTLGILCERLDIPVEDSVAFGDAANDIAMLKAAGCAVVCENGTKEAKAVADLLCESCDDDGVRRALLRFMEEGKM